MASTTISWYPGHMVKAKRLVSEHLKLVDVVLELIDARIPSASRNPDIAQLIGDKPHLILLNKADLADPDVTKRWQELFRLQGTPAIAISTTQKTGLDRMLQMAQQQAKPALDRWIAKGRKPRSPRLMMVGIPNVGKSTLINRLVGKNRLKVADRPGVTRQQQWVKIRGDLDLLDMPGILMPRIGDFEVGMKLAASGAISDEVYDLEGVARSLALWLAHYYPEMVKERFKLEELSTDGEELLDMIGARRGALVAGGRVDSYRAAQQLLNEFRGGKVGRISLEWPNEVVRAAAVAEPQESSAAVKREEAELAERDDEAENEKGR